MSVWRIIETVLSLGLNLVIERYSLSRRWLYALWFLIVLNEIRGMVTVYYVLKLI
jgi:hypothetical protein